MTGVFNVFHSRPTYNITENSSPFKTERKSTVKQIEYKNEKDLKKKYYKVKTRKLVHNI